MRRYIKINSLRLLNIKVIYNDNEFPYEGPVEEVPYDVGQLEYSKIKQITEDSKNIWVTYVYSDEYILSKGLD